MDNQRDFVARQYASLIANGHDKTSALERLRDVLGEAAADCLGPDPGAGARPNESGPSARLAQTAADHDGNAADTQAAFIESLAEARLFALDWWRPARTFLLYIVVLLALAVVVAAMFSIYTLPYFQRLYRTVALPDGAAQWIVSNGAIRLFGPLIVIALLLLLLALLWYFVRQRVVRLEPLAGRAGLGWLYGRAGNAYHALLCLEYAAVLKAGSVAEAPVLGPARELAGWPSTRPLTIRGNAVGEKLEHAQRLGTFETELDWQRRLSWSDAQARLELWRDRMILAARILFYILIGIMVTVLYIPIFSLPNVIGVS